MQCTRYLWIIALLIVWQERVVGQDIHYSQFYYNQQSQNPALIGNFDGDHRLATNYRNQWLSVPVPYMSISLFYDTKFSLGYKNIQFGVGAGIDYDQAGDSHLSLAKLNTGLNCSYFIDKKNRVTLGFTPAVAQRRLVSEKLRWDNQWNGDKYDKTLNPKENYDVQGGFFFDLGAGIDYQFAYTRRSFINVGAGAFHLNKPNQTFYGVNITKVELPIRLAYHAQLNIGITKLFDLVLNGEIQQQDKYEETVGVARIRCYLNRNPGVLLNAIIGMGIRDKDSFFPTLGIEWNNWLLSGSYDINNSQFQTATDKRGGPEVTLQYIFKSVKPIGIYKKCPLY